MMDWSAVASDVERLLGRTIALLRADMVATLGWPCGQALESATSNIRGVLAQDGDLEAVEEADVEPEWITWMGVDRPIEHAQQWVHDNFVDTSWPRCPLHERHPLWCVDGLWSCDADDGFAVPLGRLGSAASA